MPTACTLCTGPEDSSLEYARKHGGNDEQHNKKCGTADAFSMNH